MSRDARFVVEWVVAPYEIGGPPYARFEAIFGETSNTIDFACVSAVGFQGALGIEDPMGADGMNACPGGGQCIPAAGRTVRFAPTF